MKKFLYAITALMVLACAAQYAMTAGAAPYPTGLGGTGTSTSPQAGQVPIGTNVGTYGPAFIQCGAGCTVTTSTGGITITASGTAAGTVFLLQGGHGIALSPASITASGTIAVNTSTIISDIVLSGQFLPSSTVYIATTTGNWAGTWQGTNSSTYYLATNPSGFVSSTPATTTINGTKAATFYIVGTGNVTTTVSGATTTFTITGVIPSGNGGTGTTTALGTNAFTSTAIPTTYVSTFNGGSGAQTYNITSANPFLSISTSSNNATITATSAYVISFNGATGTATFGVTCASGCTVATTTTSAAITVTGGGSTTNVYAGTGISVAQVGANATITNTGVTTNTGNWAGTWLNRTSTDYIVSSTPMVNSVASSGCITLSATSGAVTIGSTCLTFYNITSANGFISVATSTNNATLTYSSSSLNLGVLSTYSTSSLYNAFSAAGTGLTYSTATGQYTWTNPGYITSAPATATIQSGGFTWSSPFVFGTSTGISITSSSGNIVFGNTGVTTNTGNWAGTWLNRTSTDFLASNTALVSTFNGSSGATFYNVTCASGCTVATTTSSSAITVTASGGSSTNVYGVAPIVISQVGANATASFNTSTALTLSGLYTFNGGLTMNSTETFNSSTFWTATSGINFASTSAGGGIYYIKVNDQSVTTQNGDSIWIQGGGGNGPANGGNIYLEPSKDSSANGHVTIVDPHTGYYAWFNASALTNNQTFSFPDKTGTFCLTASCLSTLNGSTGTYNLYAGGILSISTGTASTTISLSTTTLNTQVSALGYVTSTSGSSNNATGTTGYGAYFTGTNTLASSTIYGSSTFGINTTSISTYQLNVQSVATNTAKLNVGAGVNANNATTDPGGFTLSIPNDESSYYLNGLKMFSAGSFNTFIGSGAGGTTTPWDYTGATPYGNYNTAIGAGALGKGVSNNSTTGGYSNVGTGFLAGLYTSTGHLNAYYGNSSCLENISGSNNTCLGVDAGYNQTGDGNTWVGNQSAFNWTSGKDNTVLGMLAGNSGTSGTNDIIIGQGSDFINASTSNAMNIKNFLYATGLTDYNGNDTSTVNTTAFFGIGTSSPATMLSVQGDITDASLKSASFVGTDSTGKFISASGAGTGTVTTGTVLTAGQIAVGTGASAIGSYSTLTFASSTGAFSAPTGTFTGTLTVNGVSNLGATVNAGSTSTAVINFGSNNSIESFFSLVGGRVMFGYDPSDFSSPALMFSAGSSKGFGININGSNGTFMGGTTAFYMDGGNTYPGAAGWLQLGGTSPTSSTVPAAPFNLAWTPPAQTTTSVLLFGSNQLSGGNGSGTLIGANPGSSANADFINFQENSSTKFQVASSGAVTMAGHRNYPTSSVTLNTCGGGGTTISGSDNGGLIKLGSSTASCGFSFAKAWGTAAVCDAELASGTANASATFVMQVGTGAATITAANALATSSWISYMCQGNPN